jgi:hypothetical protein
MDINSLGAAASGVKAIHGATPMTMTSPPPTGALKGTLGHISQQLGMSISDVQSALKTGRSINDLAATQGVNADTLRQGTASYIEQMRGQKGQAPLSAQTGDQMLQRAFNTHRRTSQA